MCEIGKDIECAWQLIIDRLNEIDRLDDYERIIWSGDWSRDRGGAQDNS